MKKALLRLAFPVLAFVILTVALPIVLLVEFLRGRHRDDLLDLDCRR